MKYNKGFANVLGIILAAAVILAGAAVIGARKKCQQAPWSSLLPSIKSILLKHRNFSDIKDTDSFSVNIAQEVDLTGDGCSEAFVSTNHGGAYVSDYAIFRQLKNKKLVLVQWDKNNNSPVIFGVGASVKHQLGYGILPKNAFYTYEKELDDNGQLINCSVEAYQWNKKSSLFKYNQGLSQSTKVKVCGEAPLPNVSDQVVRPIAACLPNTPPSITITNPIAGASYTVGQNINITWTACNVQNISLGLMSGGKDFGEIAQNISASLGSYQWQVSNPAQAFTGSNINTYQIVAQSLSPDVTVRSGIFSVQ